MAVSGLISIVIYLIAIGLIFWLVCWGLSQISVPASFPDPTKLTTDAVAKAEIEKLFDTKLGSLRELIASRDTAVEAAFKAQQELARQLNESNTVAVNKAALDTTKQIESIDKRLDDIKERIAELRGHNWAAIGGYLTGAAGLAALVVSALRQ